MCYVYFFICMCSHKIHIFNFVSMNFHFCKWLCIIYHVLWHFSLSIIFLWYIHEATYNLLLLTAKHYSWHVITIFKILSTHDRDSDCFQLPISTSSTAMDIFMNVLLVHAQEFLRSRYQRYYWRRSPWYNSPRVQFLLEL